MTNEFIQKVTEEVKGEFNYEGAPLIGKIAAEATVDIFVEQHIHLTNNDGSPITFLQDFQKLVQAGCELSLTKYPRVRDMFPEAHLVKKININNLQEEIIESSVRIHAKPIEHSQLVFDEDYMKELPWATFRAVCKYFGITGRDRSAMTAKYLKAVSNEQ